MEKERETEIDRDRDKDREVKIQTFLVAKTSGPPSFPKSLVLKTSAFHQAKDMAS